MGCSLTPCVLGEEPAGGKRRACGFTSAPMNRLPSARAWITGGRYLFAFGRMLLSVGAWDGLFWRVGIDAKP
jgi:hypothetical protein